MASVLNFAARRFVAAQGVRNAGTAAVSGSHEGKHWGHNSGGRFDGVRGYGIM